MVTIVHHPRGFCSRGIQRCPRLAADLGAGYLIRSHQPSLREHGGFAEIPIMTDASDPTISVEFR